MAEEETAKVKAMYLEIVRKEEYDKWKSDRNFVGDSLKKLREPSELSTISQEHRFSIAHLGLNFAAWHGRLATLTVPMYTFADVRAMALEGAPSRRFHYVLDDLTWECEYSVMAWESQRSNVMKTLVIHMPNDGYFYVNGVAMEQHLGAKMRGTGVPNPRHRNTCYEGWSILDTVVWQKLAPFENFMMAWFGAAFNPTCVEKSVYYHSEANRIDLIMRHQDLHVGIEFSFEHDYPIALDDEWFTTF